MTDMLKGRILIGLAAASLLIAATGCTVEDNPPATNTVIHDTAPGATTHTETNTVVPGPSTNTVVTPDGSSTTTTSGTGMGKTTTTTTTG